MRRGKGRVEGRRGKMSRRGGKEKEMVEEGMEKRGHKRELGRD